MRLPEGLRSFRSVKRRLEVKAEVHGITIIDDFAHHPTAIAETLKAVRTRYPGRRCGRFWSRVRTRYDAKCFSTSWHRVSVWPIKWSWQASSSQRQFLSMNAWNLQ